MKCTVLGKVIICMSALICGTLSAQESDLLQVKGTGTGETETAALKDAYRDAVETAVGMYVDVEQLMKHNDLIKDEILKQSNAYIESYKVFNRKESGGLITITIFAQVRKRQLTKRISGTMEPKTFTVGDGLKNFHAQDVTTSERNKDGAALLKKELDDLHIVEQLLTVSLVSLEPVILELDEPRVRERQANLLEDSINVAYLLKIEVDRERYFKEFLPHIMDVLEQISITKPTIDVDSVIKIEKVDERQLDPNCPLKTYVKPTSYAISEEWRHRLEHGFSGNRYVFDVFKDFRSLDNYNYSLMDKFSPDPSIETMIVRLVSTVNPSMTLIKRNKYTLDKESSKIYLGWEKRQLQKNVNYIVSFVDESGQELAAKKIKFNWPSQYMLSCEQFGKRRRGGADRQDDFYSWEIAPWIGTDRDAYYQWFSFRLAKDELPKIKSIKVELAE